MMTLSEAIRAGAKLRPQCRGRFFGSLPGGMMGSCAIGAAYEAITGHVPHVPLTSDEAFLIEQRMLEEFPAWSGEMWGRIFYDNDGVGRTREEIADWLEAEGR